MPLTDDRQDDLFRPSLEKIINLRHPLVRLAAEIDWDFVAGRFHGRPTKVGRSSRMVASRQSCRNAFVEFSGIQAPSTMLSCCSCMSRTRSRRSRVDDVKRVGSSDERRLHRSRNDSCLYLASGERR
jgi:hypothetical protein